MLKLFTGMAVERYGLDLKASRSTVAANLSSDLQLIGLSITENTIRKYLREGAELLPPKQAE